MQTVLISINMADKCFGVGFFVSADGRQSCKTFIVASKFILLLVSNASLLTTEFYKFSFSELQSKHAR